MRPSKADFKKAFFPMWRGTIVGSLCSLIPGTGPTIASFVSYAVEKKISRHPERFGYGEIRGVACPEASTHSSVQGDFIPTMSLGIPGDAVMALCIGATASDTEPTYSPGRDGRSNPVMDIFTPDNAAWDAPEPNPWEQVVPG